MYDVIIQNGTIIDGTGRPMFRSDIGLKEGFIAAIGELHQDSAKRVADASGLYVAPGFIDVDNHSDAYWQIFSNPNVESLIYQGVTTLIGGNCGSSPAPLSDAAMLQSIQKWSDISKNNLNWLSMEEFLNEMDRRALSVNFATLSGHSTLRRDVLRDDSRNMKPHETAAMVSMADRSLKEGSFGLSFGLEHLRTKHDFRREIEILGHLVKKRNGVCSVHLRNESWQLIEALEEIIQMARSTRCKLHISHLKAVGKPYWHLMEKALQQIETAWLSGVDATFDVYPYTNTGTDLYMLLPDWLLEGGRAMMIERLKDVGVRHETLAQLREKEIDYSKVTLLSSPLNKLLTEQSISEIAKNQNKSPEEVLVDILLASGGHATISMEVVSASAIENALAHHCSIISTNGSGYSLEYRDIQDRVHPRNFGTFPLVLAKYVREKKLLQWEEAIYKMSGKPAEKFSVKKRGVLRKGNYADIVVFDPEKIDALATLDQPYRYAVGMRWVLVNGIFVLDNGSHTGNRPGEVLRKSKSWFF